MPLVDPPPRGGNADILKDICRRLDVLEARSRVIRAGSLVIQDNNGHNIDVLGQQADGTYGLKAFNSSGTTEVVLGQQADGTYGLKILNDAGVLQRVGGVVAASNAGTIAGSSNTVTIDTATEVTVPISASGQAIVVVSAIIALGAFAHVGFIGCCVDGATSPFLNQGSLGSGLATAQTSATITACAVLTGLSAGSHTFALGYQNSDVNAIGYSSRFIQVQPL